MNLTDIDIKKQVKELTAKKETKRNFSYRLPESLGLEFAELCDSLELSPAEVVEDYIKKFVSTMRKK